MAFTNAQRVKIRKYLGWPAWRTSSTVLESAIDLVGADVDGQAEVVTHLANLATIETEINSLHSVAVAKRAEETELNPDRYRDLRAAGRRECQAIAIICNTDVVRDIFGGSGMVSGPLPL